LEQMMALSSTGMISEVRVDPILPACGPSLPNQRQEKSRPDSAKKRIIHVQLD
jgi:hypothetical protein